MNAFAALGAQTVDGAADAITLPRDVVGGAYSLPPMDAPGISEDDAYNVYRNGEYIGNRLANQEGLIRRSFGLGSNVTGSSLSSTAIGGRAAIAPNILGMGGGGARRGNKPPSADDLLASTQNQGLGSPKLNSQAQRRAARIVKRVEYIPTTRGVEAQTSARNSDHVPLGRQQTYRDVNGELKSVQRSDDLQGRHAGMVQIEGGPVRTDARGPLGLKMDKYGRPRLKNSKSRRNVFD